MAIFSIDRRLVDNAGGKTVLRKGRYIWGPDLFQVGSQQVSGIWDRNLGVAPALLKAQFQSRVSVHAKLLEGLRDSLASFALG